MFSVYENTQAKPITHFKHVLVDCTMIYSDIFSRKQLSHALYLVEYSVAESVWSDPKNIVGRRME